MNDLIYVKSHVGRDVLQNAEFFGNVRKAVWEYVANSLQYKDADKPVHCEVVVDKKRRRITIADNGRGMDRNGLRHFFTMHAENLDRLAGTRGRGRFGTGKSAAFGIASILKITTVRDGRLNSVELTRGDLKQVDAAERIPVRQVVVDQPASRPNGTVVEIEDVFAKDLEANGIIAFIERHLSHGSRNDTVTINNHVCEPVIPDTAKKYEFSPTESVRVKS